MKNSKTLDMIRIGIFAGLTAVLSQINLPLGFTPVPINLATFSVMLSGALLGWKKGTISQIIYVLLGVIGLPVFAGFSSGIAVVVGPTGGYIIGYILGALVIGLFLEKIKKAYIPAFILGMLVCYALGTAWFMISTQKSLAVSLGLCVYPFILGDVVKIITGYLVAKKLEIVLR
ncbi:MAG: biotin transporter BioY [Filifactoraceae bacterium]